MAIFINFFNLNPSSLLTVESITSEGVSSAVKTAEVWSQTARQRSEQTDSELKREHLLASSGINDALAKELPMINQNEHEELKVKASVCKDLRGKEQGMMVYSTHKEIDYLYVNWLATNPDNLQGSTKRTPGAGTTLLKQAQMEARVQNKQKVCLTSIPTSTVFYHRVGFKMDEASDSLCRTYDDFLTHQKDKPVLPHYLRVSKCGAMGLSQINQRMDFACLERSRSSTCAALTAEFVETATTCRERKKRIRELLD